MQIPVIKQVVERFSLEELNRAEASLLEGEPLAIPIEGEDEGEQLTHVMAAIWIHQNLDEYEGNVGKAIRAYTQKVRKSIS